MVHRILQEVLEGNIEIDKKLEAKCKHSSERERAAMESERAANKYKQVEYMQSFLGDEFEGVISGVAAFGFWVETVEHKCEGLVSINSLLEYDDFRHIESDYSLVGRRSGRQFRMGDKVTIKIVAANLTKRQLDYEWVITAAEKSAFGAMTTAEEGQEGAAVQKKAAEHGGHGDRGARGGGDRGPRKHGGQDHKSGGRKQGASGGAAPEKRRKKKK
jgi:ribonuclease R